MKRAEPLPPTIQARAERFFGRSLDGVRFSEDPAVARMGARAFAVGDHLIFAPGAAQFHTSNGVALLGHELAHVLQQREGFVRAPLAGTTLVDDPVLERAADQAGQAMVREWGLTAPREPGPNVVLGSSSWGARAGGGVWSPDVGFGLDAIVQANWFTDAVSWTAGTVRKMADYLWLHKKNVVVVGAIVFQAYNAPSASSFLRDAVGHVGVSLVTAHVVMRVVRMVDANLQIRSPVFTWPLGMAVLGAQGAIQQLASSWLMPTSVPMLPSANAIIGSEWFPYAISNIISHAFFEGFDFRKALSPRRGYRSNTEVHTLYIKFPAPELGLLSTNPLLFLRGHIIPYKGIASGHSDPSSTSGKRHDTHHWEDYGYGPWWVIAASENLSAIKYAERLAIRYLGAAKRIRAPNVGQTQQDFGIFAPAALTWKRPFIDEFVVWHFNDGLKHIAWLFEPAARYGVNLIKK